MPAVLLRKLWARRPAPALRVLMVCTGNICRSPTAEAVLRHRLDAQGLQDKVLVDSAGTHAHIGSPSDPRAQRHAKARGYDLSRLRGRQVETEDFVRFDLILAMDAAHLAWMERMAQPGARAERALITERAQRFAGADEVPDPYYGAPEGFDQVLDMLEDAVDGWLPELQRRLRDVPIDD